MAYKISQHRTVIIRNRHNNNPTCETKCKDAHTYAREARIAPLPIEHLSPLVLGSTPGIARNEAQRDKRHDRQAEGKQRPHHRRRHVERHLERRPQQVRAEQAAHGVANSQVGEDGRPAQVSPPHAYARHRDVDARPPARHDPRRPRRDGRQRACAHHTGHREVKPPGRSLGRPCAPHERRTQQQQRHHTVYIKPPGIVRNACAQGRGVEPIDPHMHGPQTKVRQQPARL